MASEKLDDKKLLGFDTSSLIKLRAYKVLPKDSSKSHIMKILFPRKQLAEKLANSGKSAENKLLQQILLNAKGDGAKNLERDFIEVDNVLLVRDPVDLDFHLSENKGKTPLTTAKEDHTPKARLNIEDLEKTERMAGDKQTEMGKSDNYDSTLQREFVKRENGQNGKEEAAAPEKANVGSAAAVNASKCQVIIVFC